MVWLRQSSRLYSCEFSDRKPGNNIRSRQETICTIHEYGYAMMTSRSPVDFFFIPRFILFRCSCSGRARTRRTPPRRTRRPLRSSCSPASRSSTRSSRACSASSRSVLCRDLNIPKDTRNNRRMAQTAEILSLCWGLPPPPPTG